MKNLTVRMNELAAIARTHRVNRVRCNHVAGIYYNNTLIAWGRNQKKSHPLQARFSDRPARIYLHAEIDAIVKFLREFSVFALAECEMVVVRIDVDGELVNSRPCKGCTRAIVNFNIKDLEWS